MPGNTDLRYHISRLNKNPQHISCRVFLSSASVYDTIKEQPFEISDRGLRRASIPLKPAPDMDWCPFRLHRCSRYNHRTTFRNQSLRASTSINTRPRRASFPLKPAADIVWCPFPLRHTRNQHGLSAITTRLVSIVNACKVYYNFSYSHCGFWHLMCYCSSSSLLLLFISCRYRVYV